jgi:hypothetical protein
MYWYDGYLSDADKAYTLSKALVPTSSEQKRIASRKHVGAN